MNKIYQLFRSFPNGANYARDLMFCCMIRKSIKIVILVTRQQLNFDHFRYDSISKR